MRLCEATMRDSFTCWLFLLNWSDCCFPRPLVSSSPAPLWLIPVVTELQLLFLDAQRALELLQQYRAKLDHRQENQNRSKQGLVEEDHQLHQSLDRVINVFQSQLFGALLGEEALVHIPCNCSFFFFPPSRFDSYLLHISQASGYFLFKKVFECTFDLNHVELHSGTTDLKCVQFFWVSLECVCTTLANIVHINKTIIFLAGYHRPTTLLGFHVWSQSVC